MNQKTNHSSHIPPSQWNAEWLTGELVDARLDLIFETMQRGLIYPSPYAIFSTFWRRTDDPNADAITIEGLRQILLELRAHIHENCGCKNSSAALGVNINLWLKWCGQGKASMPAGMQFQFPTTLPNGHKTSTVFERSTQAFQDSEGDLWFFIKSDSEEHVRQIHLWLENRLINIDKIVERQVWQFADSRSNREDKKGGKVLGRRFSENLNNPADPITIANHSLVGYEDWKHLGASFVLAQRFVVNWEQIHAMSETQVEDVIGRKVDDTIIPTRDTRSHIKSGRARNAAGDTTPVLRLGLPFGQSEYLNDPELALKGSNIGDEEGIYFAGFAKSVSILETIMNQMIGDTPHYMNDRLFNHAKSDLGGFFYIPSTDDLGLPKTIWGCKEARDWSSFPGINWNRLDRHFDTASPNGLMYYNHKNYLYRMSTMSLVERERYRPPSIRILTLLADSFSRWQDNWYFDRKQEEMGTLYDHVAAAYGAGKAREVMALPIMERKGWAVKMTLRLVSSEEYGFRGTRKINGRSVNGADTYRIHPLEILVGAMPNLSLSQGRYVMEYLTEEERRDAFLRNLSEASGVGHTVPGHRRVLELGLGGLRWEAERYLRETQDPAKASFYRSVMLALEGVSEYCLSYAELAEKMAQTMQPGQCAERDNLERIAGRMRKLSEAAPETFVEAAQLLFTMHSCLHLTGEPTAIGRFDQMLEPFYRRDIESGTLNEESAQDIVDAFWVKLGEKVQQNRLNVEDHQPFGNLAMGGSSGPYPKGGATNQWIQQLTVGGLVADDQPQATPAYNAVTKLALRAAGRLPLNAPCLSLRVHKDTPPDILHEAAKAILSGGAHPILLNDDKIVPGMLASGNGVGGPEADAGSVAAQAGTAWDSTVSLRSARDYACDGCYEPQFSGENWFTLGGLAALDPLECALNMGKTYSNAGPGWYRGKLISFNSPPPSEIKSFDELLALYFKHFSWLHAKYTDQQMAGYGAAVSVCPSPLLSPLIDGCLEKGRDYYDGGSRYNIVAPCFFGLSSVIDSLYAIKHMVFEKATAVTSLPELVEALICDWGHKMVEPFISELAGPIRIQARARRFRVLREIALRLPKYGRGNAEVDAFGDEILSEVSRIAVEVFCEPLPGMTDKMVGYAKKYGTEAYPFGFQIQPGVGNFENFVENGQANGASADGRRLGETVASDLSPTPSPADRAPEHRLKDFGDAQKGYTGSGTDSMWDGAPVDFNIAEDFPLQRLETVLANFAQGQGSNILTVTCASPETFAAAGAQPEMYDLLRARMGGWTEYFTCMFPDKQAQQQRRPLSEAKVELQAKK